MDKVIGGVRLLGAIIFLLTITTMPEIYTLELNHVFPVMGLMLLINIPSAIWLKFIGHKPPDDWKEKMKKVKWDDVWLAGVREDPVFLLPLLLLPGVYTLWMMAVLGFIFGALHYGLIGNSVVAWILKGLYVPAMFMIASSWGLMTVIVAHGLYDLILLGIVRGIVALEEYMKEEGILDESI